MKFFLMLSAISLFVAALAWVFSQHWREQHGGNRY